ncbi:hypothetical protein Q1695_007634 [Nippostrongylus brasiliensis]|nr:hypothetical protein Q1695_007634 [Nippostrongylus brasiliensis]
MTASKGNRCDVCHKSFACRRYVVKHMARVHSKEKEDRKPLECAICGKSFPRLSHLQRHQLIHIKEREWGCPFCEQSFVQKPHLMRHIGRWHASHERTGLEAKIAANKWRGDDKPIDVVLPENSEKGAITAQQCGDLVARFLCVQCGSTFDNRTDLQRHSTNTHRPMKCSHCGDTFDGFAKLRAHQLRRRDHVHVCRCGASFNRFSELRTHRDCCRKRGSFFCLVCERVFTQRVQLDRHWNRQHFTNAQCTRCGWVAATPLRRAEHALEVHKSVVCGYCDQIDPAIDHVSTVHWKRLSKSMPLKKKVEPTAESAPNNVTKADAEENTGQSRIAVEIELQDVNGAVAMEQSSAESACVTSSESSSDLETEGESCLEEGAASAKDADNPDRCVVSPTPNPAQEQSYVNVVLSVPDDVVDEFRFGERLPPEFQRLFPELATARVCIVEPFAGQKRFLSLHIPVTRPAEASAEAERLLTVPIYV